jgi:hypothetical protein
VLRGVGQTYPVEDPRSYVHYIPWAELTSTSDEELRRSGISLDVPFFNTATASWVVWSPPLPGFAWNHHLQSEDEVYQYHVIHDWASPDHYVSRQPDKIVFRVRQLDETEFTADLKNYWEAWVSLTSAQWSAMAYSLFQERLRTHCGGRHRPLTLA